MNCRSVESLFSSYVEDEISQEERRSVESHLMGCRRCSLAMREVRATMSMLARMPEVSPSSHFDEDLYARIRSGEGLRPTVSEWIGGFFAPARFRPALMAGAGVCAVAIAALVSPFGQSWMRHAPVTSVVQQSQEPAASAPVEIGTGIETGPNAVPAPLPVEAGGPTRNPGTSSSGSTSVVATAAPSIAAESDSTAPQRQPYRDEIINDMFYLERGRQGQDPSVVPVSDQGDGVYIVF